MRVHEVLGAPRPQVRDQLFGVEIEVENARYYASPGEFWDHKPDGSLRDEGREFITAPITLEQTLASIDEFYAAMATYGWVGSIRTGIHVHADMRDRTLDEVRRVCVMYAAIEPLLFELAGPEREQCTYCVPWYRTPAEVEVVFNALTFDGRAHVVNALHNLCKYTAMYAEPLARFGTLEFRQAPTFPDPDSCKQWIKCIANLVSVALSYNSADELGEYLLNDAGAIRVVARNIFGDIPFSEKQLRLPEKVDALGTVASLVCTSPDEPLNWNMPSLATTEGESGEYYRSVAERPDITLGDF